jgi:DNA-binding protein YbaB
MFNKLKQFKDLRTQAKSIQNMLAAEVVRLEKHGITMEMDGNMSIKSLTIEASLLEATNKTKLEHYLVEVHNDILAKAQRKMAEAVRKSGGLEGMNLPFS